MNSVLAALRAQAVETVEIINPDTGITHHREFFDEELFADLIIKECMQQIQGQYVPVIDDKEMMKDAHWDGYVQCGVDSVVAIREHFYGVEE